MTRSSCPALIIRTASIGYSESWKSETSINFLSKLFTYFIGVILERVQFIVQKVDRGHDLMDCLLLIPIGQWFPELLCLKHLIKEFR